MTTAARPTFAPARGGKGKGEGGDLSALSKQYSSRDLPAHTKLKYRYRNSPTFLNILNIMITGLCNIHVLQFSMDVKMIIFR